jgi:hypothetical protein
MIVGQNALLNQYMPTFLIRDLVDSQLLMYDSTRKAFINVDRVVTNSSITHLGQLVNVDDSVDSVLVPDGQALVYNGLTQLWTNQFIDYDTLLNKPTSGDFSFIGLSDVSTPAVPNGYVLWDATGTQLVYSTTIPAASVTGLATVATTGDFNDLINQPTSASYAFIGLSDTAKPAVADTILKWDALAGTVIYVATIPVTQVTGLAPVATAGTFGSLTNVSPTVDTLNNTTDAGKTIQWNGTQWVPINPPMRVVGTLTARNALTPTLGNQAYVVDSDDGSGGYANQWSLWIYTISGPSNGWTLLARQDSADSDSATIEFTFDPSTPSAITVGTLPTGGRITLITIEVVVPFDGTPTIEVGYTVNNPLLPPPVPAGLMTISEIDLTIAGTYSALSDILFGTDTLPGDVDITANFTAGGATVGSAQIIVSYV